MTVVRGNSRVICAALAKRHTAVGNEWLGMRLVTGHMNGNQPKLKMPFDFDQRLCDHCPYGHCIEDVRTRRIGGRDTKFRLSQGAAIACTFADFAPGSDFDPNPELKFDDYIRQFNSNLRGSGHHFYGAEFSAVKPGAFSKVEGDLFETIEAVSIWNAVSA